MIVSRELLASPVFDVGQTGTINRYGYRSFNKSHRSIHVKRKITFLLCVGLMMAFSVPSTAQETEKKTEQDQQSSQQRQRGNRQRGRNQRRGSRNNADQLKVADIAPVFKLKSLDGKSETDLASFKGKKPVVLFFGSYT